jgi:hypothetical protein
MYGHFAIKFDIGYRALFKASIMSVGGGGGEARLAG